MAIRDALHRDDLSRSWLIAREPLTGCIIETTMLPGRVPIVLGSSAK
jgi:hypothetical protein